MKLLTPLFGFCAILFGLLASTAAAAPFWTTTTFTFTTTTITLPQSTAPSTSTTLTFTTTTITMPRSTATSTTTITAPVATGTTVPEWGQCGGIGYAGPTTCDSPFVCACVSQWWCQCQPGGAMKLDLEDGIPSIATLAQTSPPSDADSVTSAHWATDWEMDATPGPQSSWPATPTQI